MGSSWGSGRGKNISSLFSYLILLNHLSEDKSYHKFIESKKEKKEIRTKQKVQEKEKC